MPCWPARSFIKIDPAQDEGERRHGERKPHQRVENVDIGEITRLDLHLLADPAHGLRLCIDSSRPSMQTPIEPSVLRAALMRAEA